MNDPPMKPLTRHLPPRGLLFALAAGGLGAAAGMLTVAPAGCASDCGNDCPVTTAIITTTVNVDPGILEVAWEGPACPPPPSHPNCRGDDRTTLCNHVSVSGVAEGYCDLFIQLAGREPMAVRIEFGPPSTKGCCRGYPVIGESTFIIPLDMDAGVQGLDGSSDAVRVLRDGGLDDAADAAARRRRRRHGRLRRRRRRGRLSYFFPILNSLLIGS